METHYKDQAAAETALAEWRKTITQEITERGDTVLSDSSVVQPEYIWEQHDGYSQQTNQVGWFVKKRIITQHMVDDMRKVQGFVDFEETLTNNNIE